MPWLEGTIATFLIAPKSQAALEEALPFAAHGTSLPCIAPASYAHTLALTAPSPKG
jgi:hypothetical protein